MLTITQSFGLLWDVLFLERQSYINLGLKESCQVWIGHLAILIILGLAILPVVLALVIVF